MIHYKDRAFCSSSGHCANRACYRWINFGRDYGLPVSMTNFKDTDMCEGYSKDPVLASLENIVKRGNNGN